MDTIDGARDRWTSRVLSLLRFVTAYLYLQHGTPKLLHVPHVAMFDQVRVLSLDGFAGTLEIVGSLLVLLGLFTRPVAFILSGEMAVAYFVVHAGQGNFFMPALNGGEEAVLYCFIFLFLAAAGGGSWVLEHRCAPCPQMSRRPLRDVDGDLIRHRALRNLQSGRQAQVESCAAPRGTDRPQPPTMRLNDRPTDA